MAVFEASYKQRLAFRPQQFNPIVFAESDRTKMLLVCLEAGQFIPVHQPGVDLALVILEGEGTVVLGEREEQVSSGSVCFAAAGEARGLRAKTRLVALHVVTPPPTEADHAEVINKLKSGSWR